MRRNEDRGGGPVDAVFRAIDSATDIQGRLTDFRIDTVTGGKDAIGEVRVSVEFERQEYAGRGLSQDVVEAPARAYVPGGRRPQMTQRSLVLQGA
jgi:2-isopropylmalate synthase